MRFQPTCLCDPGGPGGSASACLLGAWDGRRNPTRRKGGRAQQVLWSRTGAGSVPPVALPAVGPLIKPVRSWPEVGSILAPAIGSSRRRDVQVFISRVSQLDPFSCVSLRGASPVFPRVPLLVFSPRYSRISPLVLLVNKLNNEGHAQRAWTSADSFSSGRRGSKWHGSPSLAEGCFGFSGCLGRPKCPCSRCPLVLALAVRKSQSLIAGNTIIEPSRTS